MSYLDQTERKNPASIAAVVGVHLAVGYALVSGFAVTVFKNIDHIPIVVPVSDPPPPKPHPIPKEIKNTATPNPVPVPQPDPLPPIPDTINKSPDPGPIVGSPTGGGTVVAPPLLPPKPNLSSEAEPAKNWKNWITTEDYPPGAIRENVQGLVVISVTIGIDGHVRSCLVTQSSGSRLLDDATCRLYTLRARFTPARDADGNPTTAQRTIHYRWQIPNE